MDIEKLKKLRGFIDDQFTLCLDDDRPDWRMALDGCLMAHKMLVEILIEAEENEKAGVV